MFNPFTEQEIHLPSITTIPSIHISYTNADSSHMRCVCQTYYNSEFSEYTNEDFYGGLQFQKIVASCAPFSSSSNFTVAAICDYPESLAFFRQGEGKWNIVEDENYFHLMFCNDGSLLPLEYMSGVLHIFRFDDEGFWVEKISICMPEMVYSPCQYLVQNTKGGILHIRRGCDFIEHTQTCEVHVLRLVISDESGDERWQHVEDLDGSAMFLGINASLLLQPRM